jgi:intracellular multiplication protein IcmV
VEGAGHMAIRQIFKVSRKTFFNPSAWLDFDALKAQNKAMWGILKTLFIIPKPTGEETFEQAMQRQGLSETDIQVTINNYRWYTWLFLFLGVVVFVFAFYLLFYHGTLHGWLLAMAASALFFSQAFKYDFWAFQIRKRKLGCTFAEWKHDRFGNKD